MCLFRLACTLSYTSHGGVLHYVNNRAAGRRVGGSAGGSADPRVGSGSAAKSGSDAFLYVLLKSWLARPFDHKSSRDA